jgi:hypothetical protein
MYFIRSRSLAAAWPPHRFADRRFRQARKGDTRRVPIGMRSRNGLNFQALWIASEAAQPAGLSLSLKK